MEAFGRVQPKPLIITERFHFHKRDQVMTNSLEEYQVELHQLPMKCNFGPYLDDVLRDCFICGIRSEVIQRKFLPESEIDLYNQSSPGSDDHGVSTCQRTVTTSSGVVAQVHPHLVSGNDTLKTQA